MLTLSILLLVAGFVMTLITAGGVGFHLVALAVMALGGLGVFLSMPASGWSLGGFDRDDTMSPGGKARCVRPGSRANIQQGTGGTGDQMEDMLVFLCEGNAFGALDKVFGFFPIALRTVNHPTLLPCHSAW